MIKFSNLLQIKLSHDYSKRITILWIGMILSTVCMVFFALDVFGDVFFGHDFPNEKAHLIIESFVVVLSLGAFIFHIRELNIFFKRHHKMNDQMRVASGQFALVIETLFDEWTLTPAERDVAIYLIKGMSFSEIADIRQSKEGTIKAQTNAIYRKANVGSCHELLSLFLDELLTDISLRK
ncbi:MAG: LuxR C-terminal-related transcriptional regulator [Emcibacter sp.]|nr:LuxR C-terminal-related transcriptional regulator [Emcibacter sp.]